jgi:predicted N-acyltransferase
LKSQIFESIADVPALAWDALSQQGLVTMSRDFWSVVEQSRMNDFSYQHVLFLEDDDTPIGIVSFYSITTDIAIFAPSAFRTLLSAVRRVWPGFLKLKMLECGTPVTITSPPFVSQAQVEQLLPAIIDLLLQTAKKTGQLLIIIRDFEPNADGMRPLLQNHGYHWIDSLPNTYLDISWRTPEAYRQSMRSYFRSKLQKYIKRNTAAGVHYLLQDDFADLSEILCKQWLVVHTHAKEFQREILTPDFYRHLSQKMGERSKVLLFFRNEELVAHALLLMDGDLLRWLYVGREEAVNDGLYIYIAYAVVETAIHLGAKCLEMGLTTYAIKQDLGAKVVPIHMALRATWGWLNPFVGLGYRLMNRIPATHPRAVFKTTSANEKHAAE